MDETTAKQRIAELKQLLERYNEEYYVQDAPTVTDYEYDMLMRELETLEGEYPQFAAADSPTRHVGGTASRTFEKVSHAVQMMSLQDVFSYAEMDAFARKNWSIRHSALSRKLTAYRYLWNTPMAFSPVVRHVVTALWGKMSPPI